MRWLILIAGMVIALPQAGTAADFVVYSVYRGLDMGNPSESPKKDYFVNMGSTQGLRLGAELDVLRRVPTYDLLNEKLYKDVTFPIARIKVIHVENGAAICRLSQTLPPDQTPSVSNRAIMIGDIVRPAE